VVTVTRAHSNAMRLPQMLDEASLMT
jgi:hypothetical protein